MPTCPNGHSSGADDYCDVCGELMAGAAPAPPPAVPYSGSGPSGPSGGSGGAPGSGPVSRPVSEPVPAGQTCPQCQAERTGRFCEVDGYDFETGNPGAPRGSTGTPPATVATAQLGQALPPAPPAPAATVQAPLPGRMARPGSGSGATPAPGGWSVVVSADRAYFESVLAELGPDAGPFNFPPYSPDRRYLLAGSQVRIGRRSVSRGFTPEIDLSTPPEDPGVSHMHAVLLAKPDGGWVVVDPGSTNGTTINGSADPIERNVEVPVHDGDRIHVGVWTTITLRKE